MFEYPQGNMESLFTFVLVIEEGSFTGAAKKLSISKAAVSKQISNLERELGVTLLDRSQRKIQLTEIGRKVYEQALRVSDEYQGLRDLLSEMKHEPQGPLHVLCSRSYAQTFIIPQLPRFIKSCPKVQLHLELAERIPDLTKEALDLVLGTSISGQENTIQRRIGHTRYILCASPKYLEAHGIPEKIEDLQKHAYITHSARHPADAVILDKGEKIILRPFLWLNDVESMIACAIQGTGIIRAHDYALKAHLAKGTLREILHQHSQDLAPLYMYYPQKKHLPSSLRAFISFALEAIENY